MDQVQYNTFFALLSRIPDPRQARGQRYAWILLLVILSAGLASGQRTVWAIARWAQAHRGELGVLLGAGVQTIPSPSTFYRAVRQLDVLVLEVGLRSYGLHIQHLTLARHPWPILALDGKELRGASKHGSPVRLLSLVDQEQGIVVGQARVAAGTNELGAAPAFLAEQDLRGKVVTMDAQFTHRHLARQLLEQGADYFMVVKGNQPALHDDLAFYFRSRPVPGEQRWEHHSYDQAHGRQESRQVVGSSALNAYLDWPGVGQVLERTCQRQVRKDAAVSVHTSYAITSLRPQEASVEVLAELWRGHWVIENQTHYVRDDTLGEDRNQMFRGDAPQTLAALRNGLLTHFRHQGFASIAEALRQHAASLSWCLQSLGIPVSDPFIMPHPRRFVGL
jgi:predicted transposase YbfD/YdcC